MDFHGLRALGTPGWVEIELDDGDIRLLAKLARTGSGRTAVTRLIVLGDAVDSATLRAIPIGRVESIVNSWPRPLDPNDLGDLVYGDALPPDEGLDQVDRGLTEFLAKPVRRTRASRRGQRREPLARPDGTDPEGFSRLVAQAYAHAVKETAKPALLLAEEAGVPVVTVHRWIREARQRGFLPPARQGRAG